MSERDWQKDWDMCNWAYPGPWEVTFGSDKVYINLNGRRWIELPITDRRWDEVDFTLMTKAREALPYWLQRVRKLEEVIAKLWEWLHTKIEIVEEGDKYVARLGETITVRGNSREEAEHYATVTFLAVLADIVDEALQKGVHTLQKRVCLVCGLPWYSANTLTPWTCPRCGAEIPPPTQEGDDKDAKVQEG